MGEYFDRLMGGEEICWPWLQGVYGMTPARMARMIRKIGMPAEIFRRAKDGALELPGGLPEELGAALKKAASEEALARIARHFERLKISVVPLNGEEYPPLLKEIASPPLALYCRGRGKLSDLGNAISIVGSRKATEYAARMARRFAEELARQGITVVSGMALGIDAAAHLGALRGGRECALPTIAVLAGGPDSIYPACHRELYTCILDRGLVVSESLPGTRPTSYLFPLRNRIIAGLSAGTLVAEAGEKSGTWHTVNYALDSGRDVFALPGRAEDPACMGSNSMLKRGAKLVTSVEEILEEYPWWRQGKTQEYTGKKEAPSEEEQRLCSLLKEADRSADELFEATQIPMGRLLSLLTKLAEKGIIERKSYMCFHYILK